jgi:hypothetical protein
MDKIYPGIRLGYFQRDDFLPHCDGYFIDRGAAGIAMDERPVTYPSVIRLELFYPAFAYFEPFRNLPDRKDALARSLNQVCPLANPYQISPLRVIIIKNEKKI